MELPSIEIRRDFPRRPEHYYDDEGKPMMYGRRTLSAESLNGLQEEADRMLQAVSKPVLEATIFDEDEP